MEGFWSQMPSADSCIEQRGGCLLASPNLNQPSFTVNQVVLFPPGYLDNLSLPLIKFEATEGQLKVK